MSRPVAEAFKPDGLGPRGEAFWIHMGGETVADPARAIVLAETCRMADTLEKLDTLIRGEVDAIASLRLPDRDGEVVLQISSAVSERRLTTTVFRHLVDQLTNVSPVAVPAPAPLPDPADSASTGASADANAAEVKTVDELAEQRATRRRAASENT